MYKRVTVLLPFLLVGACAVTDRTPIVEMQGVDATRYQADLQDCQNYAGQVDVERQLLLNAIVGAVGLAAVGVFFGNGELTERAIGAGLVAGSAKGAEQAVSERNLVIRNCLRARGYRVFN